MRSILLNIIYFSFLPILVLLITPSTSWGITKTDVYLMVPLEVNLKLGEVAKKRKYSCYRRDGLDISPIEIKDHDIYVCHSKPPGTPPIRVTRYDLIKCQKVPRKKSSHIVKASFAVPIYPETKCERKRQLSKQRYQMVTEAPTSKHFTVNLFTVLVALVILAIFLLGILL